MVELFIDPDAQHQKTQTADPAQRRRWVRLEICSPVVVHQLVVDPETKTVRRAFKEKTGMILNLSGGGVLLSTFDSLNENDYILLKFEIKGFDALTDVLGKVKRVEPCADGEILVGIEFVTPETEHEAWLTDHLRRLVEDPLGFSDRLHRMVSRFVFRRQVADTPAE